MAPVETAVTSLGGYLRALREAKGSSLEDMARSTRVGVRHLEALEDERLADLPSPVFVRGFIRAYCGFLREAPDQALRHYEALAGQHAAAHAAGAPPYPRATGAISSVLVGLVLLVILGIGLIVINVTVKRSGETSATADKMKPAVREAPVPPAAGTGSQGTAPASASMAEPPADPAPGPAAAPAPAPTSPGGEAGPHRLVMKVIEPTWIRIQPDEDRAIEELLPAGASREWSAERRFLLTIGNAGGVELTLDGEALPPLGPRGAVIQRLELPRTAASGS